MNFHHIGFIVNDIDFYEKNLLYERKLNEIIDPIQNAKLSLYSNYSESFIELIQPMSKDSFTWNALERFGNHYHHICYSVNNFFELEIIIKKLKLIKILDPVPALLFDNMYVTFYIDRNKKIIEFLIIKNYENINSF
jgi:hypothetical protein